MLKINFMTLSDKQTVAQKMYFYVSRHYAIICCQSQNNTLLPGKFNVILLIIWMHQWCALLNYIYIYMGT